MKYVLWITIISAGSAGGPPLYSRVMDSKETCERAFNDVNAMFAPNMAIRNPTISIRHVCTAGAVGMN